tara:strand:+ start:686 stop:1192 length:507 start_codon:yes stop_codon:yes gene_type:complete
MDTDEYVQRELVARGASIIVDGVFGPRSKLALAALLVPVPGVAVKLSTRSEKSLTGVHPDLVKVVRRAAEISNLEFIVTEGLRTVERQKELVAKGASKTLRSRHLTGHAVDVAIKVGGEIRWDWPLYQNFSSFMKDASKEFGIDVEWGGDWTSFKDGPHYQLSWASYP